MAFFDKKKLKKIKEMEKTVKKPIIMLIDDENAHLTSMTSLLSDDYHLITAMDGQEAWDTIQNMKQPEQISLIISDQRMPKLTGIQLFEKIKDIIPNTIRIILTGFVDVPVILDAINKAKIYEFILKPFEPHDLLLRAKRAVEAFDRQQKLDECCRTLEQKVEDRTQELEKKSRELEQLNKKLEELSLIDELTGLWNIRYLKKCIGLDTAKVDKDTENHIQKQTKTDSLKSNINFIILDVDSFRALNSNHGTAAAECVLKQLAEILKSTCCKSDILVRQGWDEFLIVSCFAPRDQAPELAEHLRKAVEEHRFDMGNGKKEQLTCSIGFASYPFIQDQNGKPGEINWEKVVNIATKSLHAAKNSGRNAWVGIKSTNKAKVENLYREIDENIGQLISTGKLTVLSSIPDKNALVWMN